MRHRSGKKNSGFFVIVLTVLVLCAFLFCKETSLKKEKDELAKRVDELEYRLESEEERKEDLTYLSLYKDTMKYVEDMARTKLGLVYPDETIFRKKNDSDE